MKPLEEIIKRKYRPIFSKYFYIRKLQLELENENSFFYFIYYQESLAGYLKVNIKDAQTELLKAIT